MNTYTFTIIPVSKPRMTRSDRWRGRKCVVNYFTFKDELIVQAQLMGFELPAKGAKIVFEIPMSDSWSVAKKAAHLGKPHQNKPDVDNLCKAFFDALCPSDQHIWQITLEKRWAKEGRIIVLTNE